MFPQLFLILSLLAATMGTANASCMGFPTTPPPQAAAAGFNTLVFDSNASAGSFPTEISSDNYTPDKWYNGLFYQAPNPIERFYQVACPNAPTLRFNSIQRRPTDLYDSTITTFNKGQPQFSQTFNKGYFEIYMRVPTNPIELAWFFMLSKEHALGTDDPDGPNGPQPAHACEIDINETFLQNAFVGTVHDVTWTTILDPTAPGGKRVVIKDITNDNSFQSRPGMDWTQWHRIGLLWTKEKLVWDVDGVMSHWTPTPTVCNQQNMYLLVGVNKQTTNANTAYAHFQRVRVFR